MVVTTTCLSPMRSRCCLFHGKLGWLCHWVVPDKSMKKGGWLKLKLEVRELKLPSVKDKFREFHQHQAQASKFFSPFSMLMVTTVFAAPHPLLFVQSCGTGDM
ncbi:hypothetical protein K438DRAFT_1781890 [Mycena galopus ATCC 62051]|nr:hypothetical protein K438DRAFT_1781890 [Mycena galopus ATCC 62051]